ncbi:MAG: hypothetical protein AAGG68_01295 [Bacteroidota bacterium]
MAKLNKLKLHEETLQFLENQGIFFSTRRINRNQKLTDGYWFLGNDQYMNISFWNGHDSDRKTNNIGFEVNIDNGKVHLYLTSRSNILKAELLKEIALMIGAKRGTQKNQWIKNYDVTNHSIDEFLDALKEFMKKDKVIIDSLIESKLNPPITFIDSGLYQKMIRKIDQYRNEKDRLLLEVQTSEVRRIIRRRKGIHQKEIQRVSREIFGQKLLINPKHNNLQNKLYESLNSEGQYTKIIMEENYIDLLAESDTEINLVEVKTHNSASKCVKEGLGQLIFYYKNLHNPKKKRIKLIIAGSVPTVDEDKEFIRLIQKILRLPFSYIQI